ncbi:hypothetical protein AgCh_009468 [Apium graveolens]
MVDFFGNAAYYVVADESAGGQFPVAFLEPVKDDFVSKYGSGKGATAPANSLTKEYGSKLKEHMQYCIDHPEEINKLAKLKAPVSEVEVVMMENIKKNMYIANVRKVVVAGLAPIGCAPYYLWQYHSRNGKCVQMINDMITEFNFAVRYVHLLPTMAVQLKFSRMAFLDSALIPITLSRYTLEIYSRRLLSLAGVYGFWKHVSKLDRHHTRRYMKMLYLTKYRDQVSSPKRS